MAPRKKIDPIKAKEAKQKKIAIGGMVVLALLVAVQGPKTLKMLKGPQPPTPAAVETAPVPTGPTVPAVGTPIAGEATAAGSSELTAVADSDAGPVAADGQLVTFERFQSKDPFAPQATVAAAPAAGAGSPAGDGAAADDGATPAAGGTVTPPEPAGDGSTPVDGGFTPAPADDAPDADAPDAPDVPSLATATSIAVNGTAEDVVIDQPFPTAQPTFVLVSVAKDGRSVRLGIAGGSYANGEQTILLVAGKPLTLQNTADGTRYAIELRAVAGFPPPTQ